MLKHQIKRVWVDDEAVYAETIDGLKASYLFADWSKLASATQEERENFQLSYTGIHWPSVDEDLSFEGMFHSNNCCNITAGEDSVFYNAESQKM